MTGIDYSKPGAQAFINSWADEFASWGVDYVKLDGVGSSDIPDVAGLVGGAAADRPADGPGAFQLPGYL